LNDKTKNEEDLEHTNPLLCITVGNL